ncbi:MAG: hypothetical protein EHM41_19170, partial [Chloroflexi bacterium]
MQMEVDNPESKTKDNALELQYIKEYLQKYGLTYKETFNLPAVERMRIMKEAMQYASCKLEDTRSKAKLIDHL